MLIIAGADIPGEVINRLRKEGKLLLLKSSNVLPDYLSCHPDLFLFSYKKTIVHSPETPVEILNEISAAGYKLIKGNKPGIKYPECARYNVATGCGYYIHKKDITTPEIVELCAGLEFINVKQGMTRCSALLFGEKYFLTSDRKIDRELSGRGLRGVFVEPGQIVLPYKNYGLIGGCCGVSGNTVYFIGSLEYLREEEEIKNIITEGGFTYRELYQGPMFDGGSILFFE